MRAAVQSAGGTLYTALQRCSGCCDVGPEPRRRRQMAENFPFREPAIVDRAGTKRAWRGLVVQLPFESKGAAWVASRSLKHVAVQAQSPTEKSIALEVT